MDSTWPNSRCAGRSVLRTLATLLALSASPCLAQTVQSGPAWSIVERGGSYRVLQRTVPTANDATSSQQVETVTQLSDGMHYLKNGQ